MRFNEYSHRHGKELLQILHPELVNEIVTIIDEFPPYSHGTQKNITVSDPLTEAFYKKGWEKEGKADFKTMKEHRLDLVKGKVVIEIECSKFEMFFRDFFRFMLLYEQRKIDAGIIITLDDMAYQRWGNTVKPYEAARASLQKLIDFLKADYAIVVNVPLWCIGTE